MKASRKTSALNRCVLETLESRQMMAAGDLDLTFGVGGKVIAQDTIGYTVVDMAVQSDGKMVLVGTLNGNFAVTRLNANGTRDQMFGGGGFLRTDFGTEFDEAKAVAIQPDGKIIVVGRRGIPVHFGDTPDFAIARYNPNGTPDFTFAGSGKRTIDFGGASGANAVALEPNGKILIAGFADTGFFGINHDFAVARLLPNGGLDTTFGKTTLSPFDGDKRTGTTTIDFGGDNDEAFAISPAFRGKIVVGGTGGSIHRFSVARLAFDGSFDTDRRFGFGNGVITDGKFNGVSAENATFRDMHVSSDDSITIVGGFASAFLTFRLTSVGRLDASFGGTGRVVTRFDGVAEARHVLVNREGILVSGRSAGNFAMIRYRLNGEPDSTFGQGGKVITPVGANDAILTVLPTSDGKLLAYGRSGSVARYFATKAPVVNVFSLDPDGAEGGDNASLIFTRDIRTSFNTPIFFNLSGTATFGVDYKGPLPEPTPPPPGQLVFQSIPFVDIPPDQTTVTVRIRVVDDGTFEQAETVVATLLPNTEYVLGNRASQTVDIADNDFVRVNFQTASTTRPAGYIPDVGFRFGAQFNGRQFGWDVDNTANARDRGSADPGVIYNTFNHMQKPNGARTWEIALPNGMYEVKLAAGDPQQVDSVYRMNLEGQLALSGTPANRVRWFERTVRVQVNDGRLTLSNAEGAVNNKIAFIEIRSVPPGAVAGPVTDNVPVLLPLIANLPDSGTIFAQLRI